MLSSNKNKGPASSSTSRPGGASTDGEIVNAVMLLDRLVSATTSADILESLQGLELGLKRGGADGGVVSRELAELLVSWDANESPDNDKVLTVFWKLLLREQVLLRDDEEQAQEGVLWTCRILLQLLSVETERAAKTLLQEPAPGRILEALMDVVVADQVNPNDDDYKNDDRNLQTTTTTLSPYIRVLACQVLHRFCTLQPSLAQTQLLRAPNGLHRLGDMLQVHTDEQVRNQVLLLAATLAEWPSVAQVWIFSNLADGLLDLATLSDGDGGLTNGPVLVQDCCAILQNLVHHANPQMAAELLLANAAFGSNMTQLLDLRQGQQFLHPETTTMTTSLLSSRKLAAATTTKSNISNGKSSEIEEDDLDDLINSASDVGKKSHAGDGAGAGDHDSEPISAAAVVIPRLLASEETILRTLLDIWLVLLQDQVEVQQMAWRQHTGALRMIWEMALLSPPPTSQTPYPCAMPSIALQQYALHVVAQVLAQVSITELDRDRLLYLTCTGGLGNTRAEKYQISQAALHVLRKAAELETGVLTKEMIAFALAPPPPPQDDDDDDPTAAVVPAPLPESALVVLKLLSTIQQNLGVNRTTIDSEDPSSGTPGVPGTELEDDGHVVGLVGSMCALSLFLRDDASRTMLLKLVQKQQQEQIPMDRGDGSSFVDQLLQRLDHETSFLNNHHPRNDQDNYSSSSSTDNPHRQVAACLLRFLATWCTQAPEVVYAVLASPHATVLSNVYNQVVGSSHGHETPTAVLALPQLAGLVLGTALANLQDEAQAAGWTRETMLQILTRQQMLVLQPKLVSSYNNNDKTSTEGGDVLDAGLPWWYSSFERAVYRDWNKATLLLTRQAMVQYLTTTTKTATAASSALASMDNHNHDPNTNIQPFSGESSSPLTEIVAQQTAELESLRRELEQSQRLLMEKDKELSSVRLRVESTPTELDNIVKETTELNRELQGRIQELETRDNETQNTLAQLQQTLEAANAEKREALQQVETLAQDVESITQTYSNLEQEYQRQQETLTQLQQEKASLNANLESTEAFSTEVATLRAENNRLREDARSADAWMKMAVERFKSMEQEKVALQQRIATLENDSLSGGEAMALREQELEQKHAAAMEALEDKMQQQVDEAQDEVDRLLSELDTTRSRHEEERDQLQTRVEDLKNKFDLAISAHEEERDELQTRVEDLQQQQQVVYSNREIQIEDAKRNIMETEQHQQQQMREQLEALQNELHGSIRQRDEQIQQYEATIKELETRCKSESAGNSYNNAESIRSRDEELQQLRAANDAAQEWMATAVEHHKALAGQVAMLTSENEQLKLAAIESQRKLLSFETSARLTEQLEKDLQEESAQAQRLTAELQQKEEELQDVVNRHRVEVEQLKVAIANAAQEHQQELVGATSTAEEMVSLRAELRQKTEQVEQLSREQQSLHDKFNEANTRVCDLDMEVAELKAELQEAEEDKETLRNKTKDLEQKVQELQEAKDQFQGLKDANEQLAQEMEHAVTAKEVEIRQLTERCTSLQEQCANFEERCRDAESRSLQQESQQTAGERQSEANEVDTVQELEAQLSHLREEMDSQERESSSILAQWQESYSVVQTRCNELQSRVTELEATQTSFLNNCIKQVDGNLGTATRIEELQQLMEEKERQAVDVVSQWQSSYEYLKNENTELLSRLDALSPNSGANTLVSVNDEGAKQNAEVLTLKRQIEELEEKLEYANEKSSKVESEFNAALTAKRAIEAQLATMSQEYDDMVGQDEENRRKVSALERKVKDLEDSLNTSSKLADQYAARVRELESDIETKAAALAGEVNEAAQVVNEWEESYNALQNEKLEIEKRFEAISQEHDTALSEREQYHTRVLALESKLQLAEETKVGFESQTSRMAQLESQLHVKEEELDKLSRDLEGVVGLQEENKRLVEELTAMRSKMDSAVNALEQARFNNEAKIIALENALNDGGVDRERLEEAAKRISELEAELRTVEKQFASDSQEADEVIAQWKDSYEELESAKAEVEARLAKLEAELKDVVANKDEYMAMAEQLQADLNEAQSLVDVDQLSKLREEKAVLESRVQSLSAQREEDLDKFASQQEDLKSRLYDLEEKLRIKTEELEKDAQEADEVINQWQETYDLVVNEKRELETQLESIAAELDEMKKTASGGANKDEYMAMVEQLQTDLREAQSSVNQLANLQEEKEALKIQVQLLSAEKDEVVSQIAALREESQSRIQDLEEELRIKTEELEKDAQEADDVINQWQETYDLVVNEKRELETQLDSIAAELDEMKKSASDGANKAEYMAMVEHLQADLREAKSSADQLAKLREEEEALKIQVQLLSAEKDEFVSQIAALRDESQSRIQDLEEELRIKTEELEKDAQEADDVINQWQETYDLVVNEKRELETRLESMSAELEETKKTAADALNKDEYMAMVEQLQADLREAKSSADQLAKLREEKEAMDIRLDLLSNEKEEAVSQTVALREESQSRIQDLEELLRIKTEMLEKDAQEADEVINQWQETYDLIVNEKRELETRLESISAELEDIKKTTADAANKDEYNAMVEQLQADLREARSLVDQLAKLQEENEALKIRVQLLSAEKDEAASQAAAQQEESQLRIRDLEELLRIKAEELEKDAQEADEVINQWRETYDLVVNEKQELETCMKSMSVELEEMKKTAADAANKDDCMAMVEKLQAELRDAQSSADQLAALEEEKEVLKVQVQLLSTEKEETAAEKEESQSRIRDLEELLRIKTEELEKDAQEAEEVIGQWQETYNLVVAEKTEVEFRLELTSKELEKLMIAQAKHDDDIRHWEEKYNLVKQEAETRVQSISRRVDDNKLSELQESYGRVFSAESDAETLLESMSKQLNVARAAHDDVCRQWQERYDVVVASQDVAISRLELLSEQLEETRTKHKEDLLEWRVSCDALVAEKSEAESRLESISEDLERVKTRNETLSSKLTKQEKELGEKETALENTRGLLLDVGLELEKSKEEVKRAEESLRMLEQEMHQLKAEYDTAKNRILSLEKDMAMRMGQNVESIEAVRKLGIDNENLSLRLVALEVELEQTDRERTEVMSAMKDSQEKLEQSEKLKRTLELLLKSANEERDDLLRAAAEGRSEIERLELEVIESRKHSTDDSVRVTELQQKLDDAESRMEEHGNTARELRTKCQLLEDISSKLANTLDGARMEHGKKESDLNSQIQSLKDSLQECTNRVNELEEALAGEVEQADEAIQQWQDSYDALLAEKEELESQLKSVKASEPQSEDMASALRAELEGTKAQLALRDAEHKELLNSFTVSLKVFDENKVSNGEEMDVLRPNANRFEEATKSAEYLSLLKSKDEDLEAAKQTSEEKVLDNSGRLEDAPRKLDEAFPDNQKLEQGLAKTRKRQQGNFTPPIDDSGLTVQVVGDRKLNTRTLGSDEKEFRSSFESIKASAQILSPTATSADGKADRKSQVEQKSQLETLEAEEDRFKKLKLEHAAEMTKSDSLVRSWKEEAESLGKLLQNTRLELEDYRKNAKETILRLEARCSELEEKCPGECGESGTSMQSGSESVQRSMYDNEVATRKKAEGDILALEQELHNKKDEIVGLKQKFAETEHVLTSRLEAALSNQERHNADREAKRTLENERFVTLERDFEELRQSHASLMQERDALRVSVADLEGELKETFDGLQYHLTNEISEQATKLTVDALRRQVDELRQKAEMDDSAFEAERTARLVSEQEATRLRSDLAAIFGMEYTERNQKEIWYRATDSLEQFQRTERAEIEELKNSLERAVGELESTRTLLVETEHRANVSELRSMQLEQDLVMAKSDLELLSQMMEEMRDAESYKRVSMENRISALEDEQNVTRRLHEAELENMRNQLEQVMMEKDGLMQSLKDSEKSREAMLHASSRGRDPDSTQIAEVELVRLRMEKAHLLAAASQEASRTERRIRELREAAKSSVEAGVLVERELRAAAEIALENATMELRDARASLSAATSSSSQSGFNMRDKEGEVTRLRNNVKSLEEEKKDLQKQLHDWKQSSEQAIANLREEVRSAKAKALQSERTARHDAEVRAELARLHDESLQQVQATRNGPSIHREEEFYDDSQIPHLYDLIEQQRNTIKEQREAHLSLENDFEGLLALLAQSKLVEDSLSTALVQIGGEKAVHDAITKAEEKALAQYGTFVRVGS